MAYGNPQRSSVFSTKALDEVPRQTLWKSIKLFQYRELNTTEATSGPLRFIVDIPTLESITVPIVSRGMIFFTFRTENAYLYSIDGRTKSEPTSGQQVNIPRRRPIRRVRATIECLSSSQIESRQPFRRQLVLSTLTLDKSSERILFVRPAFCASVPAPLLIKKAS
jgi:hypothetical protein